METLNNIVNAFSYGDKSAHDEYTGRGLIADDRTAGDVAQQRGSEVLETLKTAAGELGERASATTEKLYEEGKEAASQKASELKNSAAEKFEEGKQTASELYQDGKDKSAEKSSEKFEEIKDKSFELYEQGKDRAAALKDSAAEKLSEKFEERRHSLKDYIGEKMESLKEAVLHGEHEAHNIVTGHGLMEDDTSGQSLTEKAQKEMSDFKESARDTLNDFKGEMPNKFEQIAEKTDEVKDSLKSSVDSGAAKIEELCNEAEEAGIFT